jgi:hypothetical protein
MARIALGITLLFLLTAGYFSFATHSKIEGYASQMDDLKSQADSARQQVAGAVAREKSAKDQLAKVQAASANATSQLSAAQNDAAVASGSVTTLLAQVDALQKQVANPGSNLPPPPLVPAVPPAEIEKLNAQLKDAQAQVAELNEVKETLTNKEKDAEGRADDLQKVVDHYKDNTIRNGLQGEVLAVNPGWNFVVLSIGDHQGAVPNAEMILTRGDSTIGKVRVTSVEPSTSVADIIPGSLARGVRVQPGDRVIFPGS